MYTAEEYKNQGNTLLREGKIEEAIVAYTSSIEKETIEGTLTNRAVAYIKVKKYK